MRTAIPAAVRRRVIVSAGASPGETSTIQCTYCGDSCTVSWPRNLRGQPMAWPTLSDHFALDHVVPVRSGGSNAPDNLTIACRPCNTAKLDRDAESFHTFSGKGCGTDAE